MKKQILFSTLVLLLSVTLSGQEFRQVIRGLVTDQQSGVPLPGANIMFLNQNEKIGTVSNLNGYFVLENIPVGRVSLQVTFVGYETVFLSNITITTGKELYLEIMMEEKVEQGEEATILGNKDKTKPLNSMSLASARTFSVEESQRYAGARGDVARMAANYAGVGTANDGVNELIIRGNSPWGLLWKLEGVDIPNPNHFGNMGLTGGPVSMLNNNLLSNSDFLTGAFAAEYGNALSGVFDLNLRKGNPEKYEFLGMVGFNGFEALAEGPIVKGSNASFMLDFRYSTLELMSDLNFDFGTGTAIPEYRDLTFKVDAPTKKMGYFSMFGLWGKSYIEFVKGGVDTTGQDSDGFYNNEYLDIYSGNRLGVAGLTHRYIINKKSYINTILSYSGIQNYNKLDSVSTLTFEPIPYGGTDQYNQQIALSSYYNLKINAKNTLKMGVDLKQNLFSLKDSIYWASFDDFFEIRNDKGNIMMYDSYIEWKFRPTTNLIFNSGIYGQYMGLNGSKSLEPRVAVRYAFNHNKAFSLAYGLHSKMQPLEVYFMKTRTGLNSFERTNKDLDFTRAHHIVLGYDWNLTSTLRIKAEAYYQGLYNAPIQREASYYSLLNYSALSYEVEDSLINQGKGRNIGLDLTFEKFLDNGLYFLLTGSVFDSKYRGSDDILRSTTFDSDYVMNFLAGKEFEIMRKRNTKSRRWIGIDTKVSTAGGLRYLPVDIVASRESLTTVYDSDHAYESKLNNYFKADIQIRYRTDSRRVSQEFAIYVENLTNHKNPYYLMYNPEMENGIETVYQLPLFPMMQYKIRF